jgi:TPR repeat protein|tara:strand:+ start:1100 stop:1297 length:198 start_codon:yes stop_codon:yes gene_type:complete
LEKSAEQGDANAQTRLGRHYADTEEYEKSVSYWEKAAEQGFPGALFGLGVCYSNGFGVKEILRPR